MRRWTRWREGLPRDWTQHTRWLTENAGPVLRWRLANAVTGEKRRRRVGIETESTFRRLLRALRAVRTDISPATL